MTANWAQLSTDGHTARLALRDDMGCNGRSADDVVRDLASAKPLKVELFCCSSGGDTFAGLRLYDALRNLDTEVFISGHAYSAAMTACMAGRVIRVQRGSRILIHSPIAYIAGTPEQLRSEANTLAKLTYRVRDAIAERTGQSTETVQTWLSTDSWFNAEQALRFGLVDEIVEPPRHEYRPAEPQDSGCCDQGPTEAEQTFDIWLRAFGKIKVRDKAKFADNLRHWLTYNVTT